MYHGVHSAPTERSALFYFLAINISSLRDEETSLKRGLSSFVRYLFSSLRDEGTFVERGFVFFVRAIYFVATGREEQSETP